MDALLLPVLLVAQGVMAGIDTVLNHEIIAKLPKRPDARREIGLHVIREAIWAVIFTGLAWFALHGAWAALLCMVLVGEVIVTACDEFVENRTRVLPQNERVLHVFLTLNLGVLIVLLAPQLAAWFAQPTALVAQSHGVASWAVTPFALAAVVWAVRDFLAWRRLRHASVAA
jgi:AcrR family transcriptional regulator